MGDWSTGGDWSTNGDWSGVYQEILPGLTQQLVTAFDPTVTTGQVEITPSLVQQLIVAFAPTIVGGAAPAGEANRMGGTGAIRRRGGVPR